MYSCWLPNAKGLPRRKFQKRPAIQEAAQERCHRGLQSLRDDDSRSDQTHSLAPQTSQARYQNGGVYAFRCYRRGDPNASRSKSDRRLCRRRPFAFCRKRHRHHPSEHLQLQFSDAWELKWFFFQMWVKKYRFGQKTRVFLPNVGEIV